MVSADSEALQGNLTATRQVIGSPAYMSPEQVRNSRDIDHRVDIWALGMTLYEFLAGRTAFDADTFPAVCAAIVADSPPPLRQVAPNVPRELENIVLKCLDKDPSRRFASVNDLILALQPFGSPRIASAVRSNQLNSGAQGSQQGTDQASTLASGRIPDGAQGSSAPAQVKSHQESMAQTLQSSGENAAAGLWPLNAAQRRNVWLLLALFGFGGGAIWKYYSAHSIHIRPKNPPIAAVPMNRASFTVRFESEPSGAQIWEGERLLGTTPLSLPIERTSVIGYELAGVMLVKNLMVENRRFWQFADHAGRYCSTRIVHQDFSCSGWNHRPRFQIPAKAFWLITLLMQTFINLTWFECWL